VFAVQQYFLPCFLNGQSFLKCTHGLLSFVIKGCCFLLAAFYNTLTKYFTEKYIIPANVFHSVFVASQALYLSVINQAPASKHNKLF